MGREIKHVPLDFNWPLNQVWHGYINPWYQFHHKCKACDGSGLNPATKAIKDAWYSFVTGVRYGGWQYHLTQDEVDALVAGNRLWDLTREVVPGKGWQDRNPPHHPTAAEVNEWAKRGFGHDSINCWICVETRAKRLGVYGYCEVCQGEGDIWDDPKYKQFADDYPKTEPPAGDGWQLWETVSEGSPVSPVFPTRDAFIEYLVGNGYSHMAAINFCNQQWVPSMAIIDGVLVQDIETAALP